MEESKDTIPYFGLASLDSSTAIQHVSVLKFGLRRRDAEAFRRDAQVLNRDDKVRARNLKARHQGSNG
jgi:hypothetical protein